MSAAIEPMGSESPGLDSYTLDPQASDSIYLRGLLVNWSGALVAGCLIIILSVAAFDVYWSFKTIESLPQEELNPLGILLIQMDGGDIALFMTCKMLGTMAAILAIPAMFVYRRWWGLSAACSLATGQIILFVYLNFA